jgi:CelD/BcsL family acetyltransferase involved in cellulose biosynthesis
VSERSWQADQGTDLFRHPDLRAFFGDLIPALAARGWLDLHLLRIDGQARAFELGMDFGGRVFSYTGAFDRACGHLSTGSVLTAEVIAGACRRGRIEYDFLRGAEGYKRRWTDLQREEVEGLLRTDAPGARLYEIAVRVKRRLKARPWLSRIDERLTGLATRWRHGG